MPNYRPPMADNQTIDGHRLGQHMDRVGLGLTVFTFSWVGLNSDFCAHKIDARNEESATAIVRSNRTATYENVA